MPDTDEKDENYNVIKSNTIDHLSVLKPFLHAVCVSLPLLRWTRKSIKIDTGRPKEARVIYNSKSNQNVMIILFCESCVEKEEEERQRICATLINNT